MENEMVKTLTEPNTDNQIRNMYNKGMKAADTKDLDTDQLYAIVLLKLNNSVVPGDYPTLKTNIEAVTGIQNAQLIIDHHTRTTIPSGTQLQAVIHTNLRLQEAPPE
jgi:hypothetical protein